MKIDSELLVINGNICKNIDKFSTSDRGLLSQNILSQLRNFIEYISLKIYCEEKHIDFDINYENIESALSFIKSRGNYSFLSKFHWFLQITASHYTLDEENSERLMLKYFKYLLKIKAFLKNTYDIDVLQNIDNFPRNTDAKLMEYYEKIADRINQTRPIEPRNSYKDRFYIQKVKPIYINNSIFYEVTFTVANDKASKSDRVIAFTKFDILHNYAVKLSVRDDYIEIIGKKMPIQIIDDWEVSIRPCELDNFANIFGKKQKTNSGTVEYRELMKFITKTGISLVEIVDSSDEYYLEIKNKIAQSAKVLQIFDILDECRVFLKKNYPGVNVIRYLLYKLNNKIIKNQFNINKCGYFSNLYLDCRCIPFDQMPFATSLKNHNPKFMDLLECINPIGREHEIFARQIKNNIEMKGILFTPRTEVGGFNNIDTLISTYNAALYSKHLNRRLEFYKDHIYIEGYANDCVSIVKKLKELSLSGIDDYSNSVKYWLQTTTYDIDCDEKKIVLQQIFEHSHVALIYGSAGTGKSTLINHISNFFSDKTKIILAVTNPAVDNLKRKVTAANCSFKTITKFLLTKNDKEKCDLLIIDECSTVSNSDMIKIIEKADFRLLVLVGDTFQIESILFGNWFDIARSFISEESIFELIKPYRSTNCALLDFWNKVRKMDESVIEYIAKNNYSAILDESIFDRSDDDQIILCLNYDGLYGINNINRFLQSNNESFPIQWGINIYKVNDPILFNESERFAPLIYNNLKGKIFAIKPFEDKIQFDIEIDKVINEFDAEKYDFRLLGTSDNGKSIISFFVNKYRSTDEDDDYSSNAVVPFQIAYAVSIHKAQGLEYNSVKIVITDEVEELITHNVFYTAITRAKEKLRIYWSPETEHKVLSNLKQKNNRKDAALLSSKFNL